VFKGQAVEVSSVPFNLSTKTIDLAKQPASLKATRDMTITITIHHPWNRQQINICEAKSSSHTWKPIIT